MKHTTRQKIILLVVTFLILICGAGIYGIYIWKAHHQSNYPMTIQELEQKYASKQASPTPQDTTDCLNDYYRINPNAKKPKPGGITLSPPCPGIPR